MDCLAMEITKKPGKNRARRKNFYKSLVVPPKYIEEIKMVQCFRKELPEKLQGIALEERIELLEEMIPQLEFEQMKLFARSLQDIYIRVWDKER